MPLLKTKSENSKTWSSRSVGAPWQHRFFYFLIALGGRHIAYLFLYPVVLYYLLLRPEQRRKSRYYLKRRFPGRKGFAALSDSFRMIMSLSRSLVDRALVGICGPEILQTEFPEGKRLADLAAAGEGLIILTTHVGCWQAAMIYLAKLKRPVHMLMQQDEGDIDRHYFEHSEQENPYRVIDPTGFLGGTLEMVAALNRGEIVCIMGDRRMGAEANSLAVNFLGAPVQFPVAAWKLAAVTDTPLAVLFPLKTGPNRYRIELAEVIRVPPQDSRPLNRLTPYLARYVAALENICIKEPYQFFNFYDMWEE
ncbi:MAG: lysophospholipid acyltransferase family protein [Pseudomonadota bacterium]|nr:lysophospholipid acyltransferase family protein [Pseudomonadota bacterium]